MVAPLDYILTYPAVAQFRLACDSFGPECQRAFPAVGLVFEQWVATQPWLLARYRQLIAHSAWRELVPTDITLPLPSYSGVMHGQRLLLLQAKALADAGDTEAAAELLASDLRFWRMVLESSDLLVTKMIATAAVQRHFEWGTLALRSSPADRALAATPPEWRAPMTADELSLRRTLAGEWVYFSANLPTAARRFRSTTSRLAHECPTSSPSRSVQPQDTLNRHSTYLHAARRDSGRAAARLRGSCRRGFDARATHGDDAFPPRSLYNLVGAFLLAAGPADYADYARRVADVEGMRRAALATLALRAETHARQTWPRLSLQARYAIRTTIEPLRWDESEQAVVFVGLDPASAASTASTTEAAVSRRGNVGGRFAAQELPLAVLAHELVVVVAEEHERRRVVLARRDVDPFRRRRRAVAVDLDLVVGHDVDTCPSRSAAACGRSSCP